jgi:hypothetical protein
MVRLQFEEEHSTFRSASLDRLLVFYRCGIQVVTIQALKRALVINQASRRHSGHAHRRFEEPVGNQFLTTTCASLSKGKRRPLFENFSLLALLHDCT